MDINGQTCFKIHNNTKKPRHDKKFSRILSVSFDPQLMIMLNSPHKRLLMIFLLHNNDSHSWT